MSNPAHTSPPTHPKPQGDARPQGDANPQGDAQGGDAKPHMARVGKYLMLDQLGQGAFGKVRLAVDETCGKQYAIKIMQKSHILENELTLQVRREIAVMKAMRHPNIVNLHEVLTSSNNLYMVMDLVTGGEVFDAVAAQGRLQDHSARSYFQQLVDAVHYCHTRRVYHRDLKPENLLLSADKSTLKITDFGLSSIKAHNASSELLHTIMGSPHYIAPEVITSAAAGYDGAKVDVWACGVILYGMLAGFLPFDESNNRSLYNSIVQHPVKYPPHFSYDVIKLLRALLQKDPDKRPAMDGIKKFAWFKLNYHPSLGGEQTPSAAEKSEKRKIRHKLRKHTDKSSKKKKEKNIPKQLHSENCPPGPAPDHHPNNPSPPNLQPSQSPTTTAEEPPAPIRTSLAVDHCPSDLSEPSPRSATTASDPTTPDAIKHTKENVDPSQQTPESSLPDLDLKNVDHPPSFSDRSDSSRSAVKFSESHTVLSKPGLPSHALLPSTGRSRSSASSEHSSSRLSESRNCGKSHDTGRSFARLTNAAKSFAKATLRHSSSSAGPQLTRAASQSSIDKANSTETSEKSGFPSSYRALFSSETSPQQLNQPEDSDTLSTTSRSQVSFDRPILNKNRRLSNKSSRSSESLFRNTIISEDNTTPSATTKSPEKVKPSSSNCLDVCDDQESERTVQPDLPLADFEPASMSYVISPITMGSKVSFTSIARKKNTPSDVSALHGGIPASECTLPSQDLHAPKPSTPSLDTESCLPSMRGFDEAMTPASSMVNSAIFKPMTGLFASLAQQTPTSSKQSMSPSVLCPEPEGDVDGNNEWCIDSADVFADVEAANNSTPEQEPVAPWKVAEDSAAIPVSPNHLRRMESSNLSTMDEHKPIFGALNTDIMLKLTPSMEAEATVTAAMRKFPLPQKRG